MKGFTLVEFLIASFCGLLLSTALVMGFITLKKSFTYTQALSRIQESGQLVSSILTEAIHSAGYQVCIKQPIKIFHAKHGGWVPRLPKRLRAKVKQGNDVLLTKHFSWEDVVNCSNQSSTIDYQTHYYFIADTGRKTKLGDKISGLYEKTDSDPRTELISGVEKMHFALKKQRHQLLGVETNVLLGKGEVKMLNQHRLQRLWQMYISLR